MWVLQISRVVGPKKYLPDIQEPVFLTQRFQDLSIRSRFLISTGIAVSTVQEFENRKVQQLEILIVAWTKKCQALEALAFRIPDIPGSCACESRRKWWRERANSQQTAILGRTLSVGAKEGRTHIEISDDPDERKLPLKLTLAGAPSPTRWSPQNPGCLAGPLRALHHTHTLGTPTHAHTV